MNPKFVDMHIHSYYSDGTMSPEEILQTAVEKNIDILAITDHDEIKGALEFQKLISDKSRTAGSQLRLITGVEVDTLNEGINYHILSYGVDLQNQNFCEFIKRTAAQLEQVSIKLIKKMACDYPQISLTDYQDFSYDRRKGGFKALHYFIEKGLTQNAWDGFQFYQQYQHNYNCVPFPSIPEAIKAIHSAGGKAVLAHPGKMIREREVSVFIKKVEHLLSYGLDGIECYYPSHTHEITEACLALCRSRNLLITCGSDCHGAYEDTEINEMGKTTEDVVLHDLL